MASSGKHVGPAGCLYLKGGLASQNGHSDGRKLATAQTPSVDISSTSKPSLGGQYSHMPRAHIHTHTHKLARMRTHTQSHTLMLSHTHTYTHAHSYTYTLTYIHSYIYAHTLTGTHTHTSPQLGTAWHSISMGTAIVPHTPLRITSPLCLGADSNLSCHFWFQSGSWNVAHVWM